MPRRQSKELPDSSIKTLPEIIVWALFFVIAVIVYGRAVRYPFLGDDVFHFIENNTLHSWRGILRVWTSNYWEDAGTGGLYRPLLKTLWMFEINVLGGSRAVALIVSLALHALNAWLIHRLLKRAGIATALAATAGMWFLLHPAHGEAILHAVGQGDILSLTFGLGALLLIAPLKFDGASATAVPSRLALGLSCFLLLINLFVKEQSFTWIALGVAVIVLHPRLPRSSRLGALCVLAAGFALALLIRIQTLGAFGAPPSYQALPPMTLAERATVCFWLLGRYARLVVAPFDLSIDYSWMAADLPIPFTAPLLWLGGAVALAGGVGAVYGWKRKKTAPVLFIAIAILSLAPFLAITPIGTVFADRHAYHSLAGAACLLGWLFGQVMAPSQESQGPRSPALRLLPLAALGAYALCFGFLSARRVPQWESDRRLWSDALQRRPRSYVAATNVARILLREGDIALGRQAAERALALRADYPEARLVMAEALLAEGRLTEALEHFRAVRSAPRLSFRARAGIAAIHALRFQIREAREIYEALLTERPNDAALEQLRELIKDREARRPLSLR